MRGSRMIMWLQKEKVQFRSAAGHHYKGATMTPRAANGPSWTGIPNTVLSKSRAFRTWQILHSCFHGSTTVTWRLTNKTHMHAHVHTPAGMFWSQGVSLDFIDPDFDNPFLSGVFWGPADPTKHPSGMWNKAFRFGKLSVCGQGDCLIVYSIFGFLKV